jgi:hypothetical protein
LALTPTEEAQTRQLIAQEAPLLSLASNEPTITSKLGATKVNLSQLPAATVPADADIYLVRQGTTDKSVAGSVLKTYFATPAPAAASETVAGIVRLATAAETATGTSQTIAVDPAGLAALQSSTTVRGLIQLATGAETTTGTSTTKAVSPTTLKSSQVVSKCFGVFNGNSPVTTNSFNVSSITRNSTGSYTITMSSAMANINYTILVTCSNEGNPIWASLSGTPPTTSAFTIFTQNMGTGGAAYTGIDSSRVNFTVFSL